MYSSPGPHWLASLASSQPDLHLSAAALVAVDERIRHRHLELQDLVERSSVWWANDARAFVVLDGQPASELFWCEGPDDDDLGWVLTARYADGAGPALLIRDGAPEDPVCFRALRDELHGERDGAQLSDLAAAARRATHDAAAVWALVCTAEAHLQSPLAPLTETQARSALEAEPLLLTTDGALPWLMEDADTFRPALGRTRPPAA